MTAQPRILVVEDEPNVRALIQRTLTNEGFPTEAVPSAEEALALLEETGAREMLVADALMPVILVSDIRLPAMNGCDLAREVLHRWPGTRVLFVSGYGAAELVRRGVAPATLPLLQKPFGPDALLEAVGTMLALPPWYPEEWKP